MAHLAQGRGTFRIDRRLQDVGRIKRPSGTTDPDIFRAINGEPIPPEYRTPGGKVRTPNMIDELVDAGRTDLLLALKNGKISPVNLYYKFRIHGVSLKFNVASAQPALAAARTWLEDPKNELAQETKDSYLNCLMQYLREDTMFAEIPDRLAMYRNKASSSQFNHTRTATQALVRNNVQDGKYSELWRLVSAIPIKKHKGKVGNALPPEMARAMAVQLGGQIGLMWWTLCCTGMGPTEYWWRPWEEDVDRIWIFGKKKEKRERFIPRIISPTAPVIGYRAFGRRLEKASIKLGYRKIDVYDARRTFRHMMGLAGIPEARREAYMGHAFGANMDQLYERMGEQPLNYYLPADTKAFAAVAGPPIKLLAAVA